MIITQDKTVSDVVIEILERLLEQGSRCVISAEPGDENDTCIYGDAEGNHCAVGLLLPEGNKDLMEFEGSLGTLMFNYTDKGTLGPNDSFIRDNTVLLESLQDLHDRPSKFKAGVSFAAGLEDSAAIEELARQWLELPHGVN